MKFLPKPPWVLWKLLWYRDVAVFRKGPDSWMTVRPARSSLTDQLVAQGWERVS